MSLLKTYTTGFYNTLLSASEAKRLRLYMGEKWIIELPDKDKLCLIVNEPLSAPKNEIIIVIHGLAGAAMDPSVISVTEKFLQEGYHVVRVNLRGSGHGAGLARNVYHAGRDEDLESVVNAVAAKYPDMPLNMVGMSLSTNMMFRYLAKDSAGIIKKSVALSPVVDLKGASYRLSNIYFGLINGAVMSMLKSYFAKRKRAFKDTLSPDWNIIKKMHQFDDLFIAPELGFKNADEYYNATSAIPLLKEIKSKWKAVICLDDPIAFSEKKLFTREFAENTTILRSGGHLFMRSHGGLGEVAFKTFQQMT